MRETLSNLFSQGGAMGIIFKKEESTRIILDDLLKIISVQNSMTYDYDLYEIILKDKFLEKSIGYITKYKVPVIDSCYIDLIILPEYRGQGLGSVSLDLFIENHLKNYKQVYIKSKENSKTIFLTKNKFEFVKENLYKDLFVRNVSLSV